MSISRRFLLAVVAVSALLLPASGAFAQAGNSDDQSQASAPQEQSQTNDQPSADDPSGANDEREAEGKAVPAPSANSADQAAQPPMSENIPGPTSPAQANENTPDPPARAARLQYFSGSVSVQPQGKGDWANAELNRPLTNSDNIWADKDSRAEISVGSGALRTGAESSLTLTRIDENTVQVELHQGALSLHVRELYNNEIYEVDTPNQAFTVSKPGDYRFEVDPNADTTEITVWRGEGQAAGNGPAITLHENEQAKFAGNAISGQVHAANEPDSFDDWARSRDEKMDNSQSAKYVSPDVPGYQDLDEYGTWKDTPDYGEVWVPGDVAVGWAPYRYGHWIWVAPWGWTWVDDTPWGFAPFHYGRWVYWGGYWGWAPGPVYVRPYYAPALVAWFGGPRFGVGFGFGGGFGWCPLGFGEPFVPWYGVSRGYFNRVNITNTHITNVNITNVYNNNYLHGRPITPGRGFNNNVRYANMRQPNGFTAVSRNTLLHGQQVGRNALRVSPGQLNHMSPVRSFNARPENSAMLGASRARITPPARSFARPTMTRTSISARGNGGFRGGESAGAFSRPASPVVNLPSFSGEKARGPMMSGSVPRPPGASMSRGAEPQFGNRENGSFGNGRTNVQTMPRGESNVPRPPNASREYSAPENRGGFSRSGPSYDRPAYSRPATSYNRGSYERPAPSYSGRSTPSYGGGGYSRPSYGSGSRAPSYGGGRASGGGGRSGGGSGGGHSGGGGHASSGGGGGHAGGGGHGGHR